MEIDGQKARFYFCAINSLGRINAGDMVLIDRECEIKPDSIVLTSPDDLLQIAGGALTERYVGSVVNVYIRQKKTASG